MFVFEAGDTGDTLADWLMALPMQVEEVRECVCVYRENCEFSWYPIEELCVVSV